MSRSLAPFPLSTASVRNRVELSDYTTPRYEAEHQSARLKLAVYLPDVRASDVELTLKGPDLIVTARRHHTPRINFPSAHFEAFQRDYRLLLRVGHGFDLRRLAAQLQEGVLKIELARSTGMNTRFESGLKVA